MRLPAAAMTIRLPLLHLAAACGLAIAGAPAAQGQPWTGAPTAPLQYESEDVWADVHRWTGSEETRPRGQRQAPRPQQPAAPVAVTAAPDGTRRVTTSAARANLRAEPSLTAPVLRAMPRGSVLRVFGEAAGGWFQVGEAEAFGWVHESVLQR